MKTKALVNLLFLILCPIGLIGFVTGFVWIQLSNGFLWAEKLAAENMESP